MAATKNKGSSTLLLVLAAFLAIAGGSAWFIHSMLSDGESSGNAAPGATAGNAQSGSASPSGMAFPPGQAVSGGTGPDPQTPEQTLSGQETVPPAARVVQPGAAQGDSGETESGESGQGPARNLLLVPGAIAEPAPAAREDAVVRPAFVDDMAAFLAQNYWPRNTHPAARRGGITTVSLRWTNLRYGAELQGMEGRGSDPAVARRAVLGYILNPAAIGRIADLYADDFLSALAREANRRAVGEDAARRLLAEPEKKEMFAIYARFGGLVAAALEKYAADPGMAAKVETYAQASRAVEEANRAYMESMIAYEDAAMRDPGGAVTAARLRMDKDAATYQKRIRERETKHESLVAAMSRGNAPNSSAGDTLVYVAFWAYRRGPDSAPALRACARALTDMSARLMAASRAY